MADPALQQRTHRLVQALLDALASEDWEKLGTLDAYVQALIPRWERARPWDEPDKAAIAVLQQAYRRVSATLELEQHRLGNILSNFHLHQEARMAYALASDLDQQ